VNANPPIAAQDGASPEGEVLALLLVLPDGDASDGLESDGAGTLPGGDEDGACDGIDGALGVTDGRTAGAVVRCTLGAATAA
jgi:hypothetical protein